MKEHIVIIGAGFGGLGAACLLAKSGYEVTVIEKNDQVGGRASQITQDGYTFDLGPSWYLMPDVFEHFFELVGEDISDHIELKQLDPSYRIFFRSDESVVDIHSDFEQDKETFEQIEPGSSKQLKEYLNRAKKQYEIAVDRFMYKNYSSIFDFLNWETMTKGLKLSIFSTMDTYVSKFFDNDKLKKIMQYSLVFLGSSPYNTPALYNIMSHVDFNMGVYYPKGGMHEVARQIKKIAEENGVEFRLNEEVTNIKVKDGEAKGVTTSKESIEADKVISNANYQFTEMELLEQENRTYGEGYWEDRTLSPSAFIMHLGIDGELKNLDHHNLFFSEDWQQNFTNIFDDPKWSEDPSFYICKPSETDSDVSPEGKETMFVLVPIAPELDYTQEKLEDYEDKILDMVSEEADIANLKDRIEIKKFFCSDDFKDRYNSFKGSALGLAHTFWQTAAFRPDTVSYEVDDLYFVGADTNPGIGVPTCLISSELVYKRVVGDGSSGRLEDLMNI
jgi:phytoene desaturase